MDINAFLPPLAGSFFGIAFGLFLNKYFQYKKSIKDRSSYLIELRNEVDEAIESLKDKPADLISEDGFKSVIYNIGQSIFNAEERYKLDKICFDIQAYNYEAGRLRDTIEKWNYDVTVHLRYDLNIAKLDKKENSYISYSKNRQKEISVNLLKKLSDLKDLDWFKNDKKSNFWMECYDELKEITDGIISIGPLKFFR